MPTPPLTGNTEIDDANELTQITTALQQQQSFNQFAFDMAFYLPVVFISREQADAFLQQTGLAACVENDGGYIDGIAAAKVLGVSLPKAHFRDLKKGADDKLVIEVGCIE